MLGICWVYVGDMLGICEGCVVPKGGGRVVWVESTKQFFIIIGGESQEITTNILES